MNSQMAWWIVDQLIQQGVRHFCIAPGSRSTPLALAAVHHPKAQIHVHYDERGLGFYALGTAKASRIPAAVIVTSGTAVGNLLPCVMEAHHSNSPLILMTADRPPELIEAGANQATDQLKIFQNFTRGQIHLPTAAEVVSESYVRSSLAHAVCLSLHIPGPVQVNWHIREPLFTPPFPHLCEGKKIELHLPKQVPSRPIRLEGNGVIAIGRLPSPFDLKPILHLAKKLQWPVFGDILSNARLHRTEEQILHFDWILKADPPKADTILHFGDRMTSKKYLDWAVAPRYIHISPFPTLQDSARKLTERILADPAGFCQIVEGNPAPASWLCEWQLLDAEVEKESSKHFQNSDLCTEAHAFRALSKSFGRDWAVYLGSGMPIRDADHFFFPNLTAPRIFGVFSNRGLSGIDGNIATAAGLSEGLQAPVVAWIGDQATLHDLNSLPLLTKTKYPVLLVVSNNFGSGIFSHLPIAKSAQTEHFERLFANAHAWEFANAAKQFNIPYRKAETIDDFVDAWKETNHSSGIIELITSRTTNFQFQQELSNSCSHVGV